MNTTKALCLSIVAGSAIGAGAATANAQAVELDSFRPSSAQRDGYLGLESGRADLEKGYELSLGAHYTTHPLVGVVDDGQVAEFLVAGQR